jgi:hypothetical protein
MARRQREPRICWLALLVASESPGPEPGRTVPPANPFVPAGFFIAHDRVAGIDRAVGRIAAEFRAPKCLVEVRFNRGA